jgi:DNA-directed RNA polymerase subunit F
MTKPHIISKEPLLLAEVQSTLKALKKRDEELTFRGNKTEEYVNNVTKLSKTKAVELKKKLQALDIPRLKDEHIIKIVDILPKSVSELKIILQGFTLTVSQDNMNTIMSAIDEYASKK